jgi:tryptophan synthase alpha chain
MILPGRNLFKRREVRTVLGEYIGKSLENREILLMTHIVVGYPSLKASYELVKAMVASGVSLIELQIPFSEPIADGPVIMKANQEALNGGITPEIALQFAERVANEFSVPFIIMSYVNIPFVYDIDRFSKRLGDIGIPGVIIPDLPLEESSGFIDSLTTHKVELIPLIAPTTSVERIKAIAHGSDAFLYCISRKGVTGQSTEFSESLSVYLRRVRGVTALPIAVGFGIASTNDVDALRGFAEIAVVGSQVLRIYDSSGVNGVGEFLRGLGGTRAQI